MAERSGSAGRRPASSWLVMGVLVLAAGLRFWALPAFPRGIEHDEVAEVLIAEGILQGDHAIYFQEAYGQEPLFLYLVALSRALIGRNVLALRFVSASVGLLTVAACARLAWRLFGRRVALFTAAGTAVTLWAVFWSRVGLRAMLLPLTMALGFDALWAALHPRGRDRTALGRALPAGLWLGLSAYTYLAARGVPLVLGGLLALLALFDRHRLSRRWRALVLSLGLAVLVAAPLICYLAGNKDVQTRVYEVDAPLQALRRGDPSPVLANSRRVLGMFVFRGDATARNNLPGRPVFADPIWALLFVGGLAIALVRLREPRYGLIWVWLIAMVSPSIVTIEAPNFVRTLGALPAAMMGLGVGAEWLWQTASRYRRLYRRLAALVLAVSLGLNLVLTIRDYFGRWPRESEVAFVWQWDFVEIAAWLDAHDAVGAVTVGGLSTQSMDAPSLDLLMQRDDVAVRWCDPGSPIGSAGALLFPAAGGTFLVPDVVPLSGDLRDALALQADVTAPGGSSFTRYTLAPPEPRGAPLAAYEGGARLLAIDLPGGEIRSGETLTILSTWQATGDGYPDLKAFVHLLDAGGALQAQHDGLDCPARFWRAGDVIVQVHRLALPAALPSGVYRVSVGLYDRQTLVPYPLVDGAPSYAAGTVEVVDG